MPRLILIPGLGASRVLFEPQRHHFDQDLFLSDWIAPMHTRVEGKKPISETLRDYARRLSERWKETILAKPEVRRSYWIGGVSLGGMIALEAAGYLAEEGMPPRGVFLIASARAHAAVPATLRIGLRAAMLGSPLLRRLRSVKIGVVAKREGLSELDDRLFRRMAEGVDIELTRWQMGAMRTWRMLESEWNAIASRGVKLHQIHGERDWVLPLPRGHADKVIPGGRHLINLTHAEQVNEYLETRMKSDAARDH